MSGSVAVIVPAYNAAATIASTLKSLLAETDVGEVIMVDDASTDDTVAVARNTGAGSSRLRILSQPGNKGPASARNRALAETGLPFVAIVDADDLVMPGRFSRLLAVRGGDWDFVADNIAFVPEAPTIDLTDSIQLPAHVARDRRIGLEAFVRGNIPDPARPRGELGFLKPLIRRDFIGAAGLRYDERLRLGEDYIFYARALAAGARFVVTSECGYVAIQRARSLSGSHRTSDLEALLEADQSLRNDLESAGFSGSLVSLVDRHLASLKEKIEVRRLLDDARAVGRHRAVGGAMARPWRLFRSLLALQRDQRSARMPSHDRRRLLEDAFFEC
jgi:succinoglycan biosynthesis protein ExoU